MFIIKKYLLLFVLLPAIGMLSGACSSSKKNLTYMQDLSEVAGVIKAIDYTNTIEPENDLVIIVKSDVPEATSEFNLPYINPVAPGTTESNITPQLQQYRVDKDGNIDFPKLGTIHVAGMTTYGLKEYLTGRISEYVNDPIVTVNLAGYRVVVMGEVGAPKTLYTSADRFSILDALAEAGDLTDYAQRENILVLRRGDNSEIEYHRIDLTSSDFITSPYFWLKNNDIVLVSPNNIKESNSRFNLYSNYKLGVISTIVSASSVIASLIIALTVK